MTRPDRQQDIEAVLTERAAEEYPSTEDALRAELADEVEP